MGFVKPYPHYEINVEDMGRYTQTITETLPLNRPMFLIRARKGEVNKLDYFPNYAKAVKVFGKETFDRLNKKYFSQASYLLMEEFVRNGAFIARLCDEKAKPAFAILELWTREIDQPSKMDVKSAKGEGDSIFSKTTDKSKRVKAGAPGKNFELMWKVRTEFVGEETWETLVSKDIPERKETIGEDEYEVYPMATYYSNDPGLWGNFTGFRFYYERSQNDKLTAETLGSLFFTLKPFDKDENESTVNNIYDIFRNNICRFVVKPDVVDKTTMTPVSFEDVIEENYRAEFKLPYNIDVYETKFKKVGDIAREYENEERKEEDQIKDGYLVNLVDCFDLEGVKYKRIVVGKDSTPMDKDYNHFLAAGVDGDISNSDIVTADTTWEQQIIKFLKLEANPNIVDSAKYPMTHMTDCGFHMKTKEAMIGFLDVREDVKIDLSTQQVTFAKIDSNDKASRNVIKPNTKEQDFSAGRYLRKQALMMRESVLKGTEACRASIYVQCGKPHSAYKEYLPSTIWILNKRAEYQNRTYMSEEPKGLPNSDMSEFKLESINWVPHAEDTKSLFWDLGVNYFQYYTRNNLHYAALRTVYPNESSCLVDDTFVDAIVYTKHEIRQSWAKFSGVVRPSNILQEQIEKDLSKRLDRLYNGKYTFVVDAYQTEEEKKIGFVQHIRVDITSPATNRVWIVDLVCHRENYQ